MSCLFCLADQQANCEKNTVRQVVEDGDLMLRFKTLLLGIVTTMSGVFVACAYGFRYSWYGIVQDKTTKAPIAGIKTACINNGKEIRHYISTQGGVFDLDGDTPCDSFVFSDIESDTYALVYSSVTTEFLVRDPNSDEDLLLTVEAGHILDLGQLVIELP